MNRDIIEALVRETDEEVGNILSAYTRLYWETVFANKLVNKCVDVCINMSNAYTRTGQPIQASVANVCGENIAHKFGV